MASTCYLGRSSLSVAIPLVARCSPCARWMATRSGSSTSGVGACRWAAPLWHATTCASCAQWRKRGPSRRPRALGRRASVAGGVCSRREHARWPCGRRQEKEMRHHSCRPTSDCASLAVVLWRRHRGSVSAHTGARCSLYALSPLSSQRYPLVQLGAGCRWDAASVGARDAVRAAGRHHALVPSVAIDEGSTLNRHRQRRRRMARGGGGAPRACAARAWSRWRFDAYWRRRCEGG